MSSLINLNDTIDEYRRQNLREVVLPDKPIFEHEEIQRNKYSDNKLNLRFKGSRFNAEPYAPDQCLAFTDREPRGTAVEANIRNIVEYNRHVLKDRAMYPGSLPVVPVGRRSERADINLRHKKEELVKKKHRLNINDNELENILNKKDYNFTNTSKVYNIETDTVGINFKDIYRETGTWRNPYKYKNQMNNLINDNKIKVMKYDYLLGKTNKTEKKDEKRNIIIDNKVNKNFEKNVNNAKTLALTIDNIKNKKLLSSKPGVDMKNTDSSITKNRKTNTVEKNNNNFESVISYKNVLPEKLLNINKTMKEYNPFSHENIVFNHKKNNKNSMEIDNKTSNKSKYNFDIKNYIKDIKNKNKTREANVYKQKIPQRVNNYEYILELNSIQSHNRDNKNNFVFKTFKYSDDPNIKRNIVTDNNIIETFDIPDLRKTNKTEYRGKHTDNFGIDMEFSDTYVYGKRSQNKQKVVNHLMLGQDLIFKDNIPKTR